MGHVHGVARPPRVLSAATSLSLSVLFIAVYGTTACGVIRILTHAWFGLIALSTVLTHQHHVIDVAGGFALGLCCYYGHGLHGSHGLRQPATTNPRVGMLYAAAAAVLAGLGAWLRPWGWPLLWPAVSLAIAAGAYFGLYAGIACKQDGRLSLAARVVMAPWLFGQQLSLVHYRRHCLRWNEVVPHVWIGRRLSDREAAMAVKQGVTAVLDLTGECAEAGPFLDVAYLNLQVLDLTAPTPAQLRAAVDFIDAHRTVYVHCKIGYSRSAAVVGAWLLDAGLAATAEEAIASIRAARPTLVVRHEARVALREFAFQVRLKPDALA